MVYIHVLRQPLKRNSEPVQYILVEKNLKIIIWRILYFSPLLFLVSLLSKTSHSYFPWKSIPKTSVAISFSPLQWRDKSPLSFFQKSIVKESQQVIKACTRNREISSNSLGFGENVESVRALFHFLLHPF